MARLSTTGANAAANAILANGTTYYLSLHSADPGTTGASEITGGSYARQVIQVGAASGGVVTSTDAQTFSGMPAEASGVPYVGIWTAATAGTYLWGGANSGTSGSANIPAGATVTFAIGSVTGTVS